MSFGSAKALSSIKRYFDLGIVITTMPIWLTLVGAIALVVRLKLGTPVFFKQKRPGYKEVVFEIYKFRTMSEEKDKDGKLLPDELRLTEFGKCLRSSSLDELPELINVLRGDMSLVGPRPLLEMYLPLYNSEQRKRHDVLPGITGWAQINGRNAISWNEKFDLDNWYVNNRSIALDIKILMLTIKEVLFRRGISARGEATMHEFQGDIRKESCKKV